jgi:predicted nucleic acid-binding protein
MAKIGKSAPPSFNSRKKNTQSFISKEKTRIILRQKGMPIDHMDLFVASVAMYYNLTLVSHNTKHFVRINILKLTDWQ